MGGRVFVKTGIPGLDKVLGDGLLYGSIVTIGGPTGSGKSTLGMQFIYEGAKQFDETGLYISIEESKEAVLFNMSGYEWDLSSLERKQKLIFLDYPIYEVEQFLQQSNAIKEIVHTANVKRVVVDSIMPIALHFKSEEERKHGFLKLIENIRAWGATTFIISEDTTASPAESLPYTTYGIESFTDGWVNLGFKYDQKKNERARFIEVLKMKGVQHSMKIYPLTITPKGITVLSK
ncbi:MAG: ATPase domain-containing protein [Candidatus Bilamarchaeaceae archaeon]